MKFLEFLKKNDLDEMQEQKLLKIEHNVSTIAFWGLFAVAMVQLLFSFGDIRYAAGELLLLLVLSVYTVPACLKAGIWSRNIPPTMKSNVIGSLLGGIFVFLFLSIAIGLWSGDAALGLCFGAIFGVVTFVLCMAALWLSLKKYHKRTAELDGEDAE